MRDQIANEFMTIQDEICQGLEELDGKSSFQEDEWERPGGGGGRTRVIAHGDLLEKGGVNFSAVHGKLPPPLEKEFNAPGKSFFATGVSIVLHPNNPHVPIIHMNIRYFELDDQIWWFGGGIDLTPHYVRKEKAKEFHGFLKATCDRHDPEYYPEFSKWADDYFFIPHRNETRGVGGIFYDRLNADRGDRQDHFRFTADVGRTFLPAYASQLDLRDASFSEREKEWQLIRRGRYVEFNLVYDRGTRFGLQTSGRIESILMSLPEYASWKYAHDPAEGTSESQTLTLLKKGIDWLA